MKHLSWLTQRLELDEWIHEILEMYGLNWNTIISAYREPYVSECRNVISYIMYKNGMTHKNIGRILNKDHTTIMHSVQKVTDLLDTDDKLHEVISQYINR